MEKGNRPGARKSRKTRNIAQAKEEFLDAWAGRVLRQGGLSADASMEKLADHVRDLDQIRRAYRKLL